MKTDATLTEPAPALPPSLTGVQERYPLTPLQHGMLLGSLRASGAGVYISDRVLPAGRWYLRFELRRGPDELRMIETLS